MTYDDVMELFDRQMVIVRLSLATSFKRYATRKEETIAYFSKQTGIPSSHFEDRLIKQQVKELYGIGS
jgi:hypothetical protein